MHKGEPTGERGQGHGRDLDQSRFHTIHAPNVRTPIKRGVAMKRMIRMIAVLAVLGLVAAACGNDNTPSGQSCSGGTEAVQVVTILMGQLSDF
jgi:predicted small secreted protein